MPAEREPVSFEDRTDRTPPTTAELLRALNESTYRDLGVAVSSALELARIISQEGRD